MCTVSNAVAIEIEIAICFNSNAPEISLSLFDAALQRELGSIIRRQSHRGDHPNTAIQLGRKSRRCDEQTHFHTLFFVLLFRRIGDSKCVCALQAH